ncbi:MAG: alpha/beta fold hydrolase [Sphingorhabdus sp.]
MRKFLKWLAILLVIAVAGLFLWGFAGDIPAKELRIKYANAESEFVDLGNGMTVHLRDDGPRQAPAIILLHGSNASLHTWQQWVDRLDKDYRIIRFDQSGHGLTGPHPKDDYSIAAFVDTVDRVARNRGLTRFYLGGNSMGGGIAHAYAVRHPGKLAGLILVDPSGAPDAKPRQLPIGFRIMAMPGINRLATVITPRSVIEKSLQGSVSNQAVVTPAEVDEYWELLRYPGNREATLKRFAAKRMPIAEKDISAATRAIPTLILWGEEDKLIPASAAKWFGKIYTRNVTRIYKGIGHLPMEENPEQSAADVRKWLTADNLEAKPAL